MKYNINIVKYKGIENKNLDLEKINSSEVGVFILNMLKGNYCYKSVLSLFKVKKGVNVSISFMVENLGNVLYELNIKDQDKREDVLIINDNLTYRNRNKHYPIMFFIKEEMLDVKFDYDLILNYIDSLNLINSAYIYKKHFENSDLVNV